MIKFKLKIQEMISLIYSRFCKDLPLRLPLTMISISIYITIAHQVRKIRTKESNYAFDKASYPIRNSIRSCAK